MPGDQDRSRAHRPRMNLRLHQSVHAAESRARDSNLVGLSRRQLRQRQCDHKEFSGHAASYNNRMNRRTFLGASAAALSACKPAEKVPRFELEELSIAGLSRWTSRQLTELYLARIDALDRKGPQLRAVIEINLDALMQADQLDRERKEKGPRGPLHGIPVLIKDNIDTADRMSTTAGSLALEGSRALEDSAVAARLRAAGALILGKTNPSEWANFRSSHSVSGWSARGGQTRNPYLPSTAIRRVRAPARRRQRRRICARRRWVRRRTAPS